jgi:hypothetical protein
MDKVEFERLMDEIPFMSGPKLLKLYDDIQDKFDAVAVKITPNKKDVKLLWELKWYDRLLSEIGKWYSRSA